MEAEGHRFGIGGGFGHRGGGAEVGGEAFGVDVGGFELPQPLAGLLEQADGGIERDLAEFFLPILERLEVFQVSGFARAPGQQFEVGVVGLGPR